MASTYSTRLRIELIGSGEQSGTWDDTTNTNLGTLIEEAIAGVASVTHDDSASYSLTASSGASDEARNMILEIGGTLTAARNVVCPTQEKLYFVYNNTSGGYAITIKTAAGTGISVPNGEKRCVYCDGTNVVDAITDLPANTQIGGSDVATLTGSQTLTNKTINLASNTLTGTTSEFNTALSDGSFATLAGTETLTNKTFDLSSNTLSGTTAEFNTALSDGSFATLAGAETLTNKTIAAGSNTITGLTTEVDHDQTTNFVANEHVDHTSVTLTAGTGLTGGGDISANRTFDVDTASAANIRAGASNKVVTADGLESAVEEVTLTDAATIAVDWSSFINGKVTLAGNRALGAPSNGEPGTWRQIRVIQDATGSRTLNFATAAVYYAASGGTAPTLSTGANDEDVLWLYCETTSKFVVHSALDIAQIT